VMGCESNFIPIAAQKHENDSPERLRCLTSTSSVASQRGSKRVAYRYQTRLIFDSSSLA
jgi:hypothetical protein